MGNWATIVHCGIVFFTVEGKTRNSRKSNGNEQLVWFYRNYAKYKYILGKTLPKQITQLKNKIKLKPKHIISKLNLTGILKQP